ncbi:hypothetical protein CC79DRAFT_920834 [Sarocladium strictum]
MDLHRSYVKLVHIPGSSTQGSCMTGHGSLDELSPHRTASLLLVVTCLVLSPYTTAIYPFVQGSESQSVLSTTSLTLARGGPRISIRYDSTWSEMAIFKPPRRTSLPRFLFLSITPFGVRELLISDPHESLKTAP